MAGERLTEMSAEQIAEFVWRDPRTGHLVSKFDPRVQLHDRLYGDPEAKKDLLAVITKHKRLFPHRATSEIDVPEIAQSAIAEEMKTVRELRKELEDEKLGRKRTAFRDTLVAAGAEATDLDKIEQFMVDNEIGPKSAATAVQKFYEVRDLAEPNKGVDAGLVFRLDENADFQTFKSALEAPPDADLDQIFAPHYEKVFAETFGVPQRGRRTLQPA